MLAAENGTDQVSGIFQVAVSLFMAIGIVDLLQEIHIDHQEGDLEAGRVEENARIRRFSADGRLAQVDEKIPRVGGLVV